MILIVKIIAIIFIMIAVSVFCVYGIFRMRIGSIKKQLEGVFKEMSQISMQTPARIHLEQVDSPVYTDEEKMESCKGEFAKLGFEYSGAFIIKEMPGVQIAAFVKKDENYIGVIYEHSVVGIFYDIAFEYEDGTSITASSAPMGNELDHMPGSTKLYRKGMNVDGLYELMKTQRQLKPARKVSKEEFAKFFEEAYAKEMDWRISRGGATEDEIRRIAAGMDGDFKDDAIQLTQICSAAAASSQLNTIIIDSFLKARGISAEDWEKVRDRVIVVHDNMEIDELSSYICDAVDYDEKADDIVESLATTKLTAREYLNAANEMLPEEKKFEKIGVITKPVEADIYLCAEKTYYIE